MKWLGLLLVTACNQVLGIHHTRHSDASIPFFDGHPDAPYSCPMVGGTPKFQQGLYQAFQQRCQSYAISAKGSDDHALGLCAFSQGFEVAYGPIGAPLQMQTLTPGVPSATAVTSARLAPDDDQAIIGYLDISTPSPVTRFPLYARVSDGNWQEVGEVGEVQGNGYSEIALISTPTRGPHRHAIALDYVQMQLLELVEGDGNTYPWTTTVLQPIDLATISPQGTLSLTPDGLQLVFYGSIGQSSGIYYADRAAMLQPFNPPVWLMDLPTDPNTDPFLTESCARLYLSGLGSLFYAVQ
jgi:hypothetical protein